MRAWISFLPANAVVGALTEAEATDGVVISVATLIDLWYVNVVNREGNCFGRSTLTLVMFASVPCGAWG